MAVKVGAGGRVLTGGGADVLQAEATTTPHRSDRLIAIERNYIVNIGRLGLIVNTWKTKLNLSHPILSQIVYKVYGLAFQVRRV